MMAERRAQDAERQLQDAECPAKDVDRRVQAAERRAREAERRAQEAALRAQDAERRAQEVKDSECRAQDAEHRAQDFEAKLKKARLTTVPLDYHDLILRNKDMIISGYERVWEDVLQCNRELCEQNMALRAENEALEEALAKTELEMHLFEESLLINKPQA